MLMLTVAFLTCHGLETLEHAGTPKPFLQIQVFSSPPSGFLLDFKFIETLMMAFQVRSERGIPQGRNRVTVHLRCERDVPSRLESRLQPLPIAFEAFDSSIFSNSVSSLLILMKLNP